MITVFANMMINSEERFEHLKDSFESFKNESDDWLINIRGKKREEVNAWLKERLGDRATFFNLTDESRGWEVNSMDMIRHAKHTYVLFWLEDHMYVAPPKHLEEVVREMAAHEADYLQHSWWMNGAYRKYFDQFYRTEGVFVDTVTIGNKEWSMWREQGKQVQLVSLLGIFKKDFLFRIFRHDRYMLPETIRQWMFRTMAFLQRMGIPLNQKKWFKRINTVLRFKLRRQPKSTPHDFEKEPDRYDMLPIRTSVSKRELFACMDDDDDPAHRSSLMTRGLYPVHRRLISWDGNISVHCSRTVFKMQRGQSCRGADAYFSAKGVRHVLLREYVRVLRGRVSVMVKNERLELAEGDGAAYFTNIPHEINALEDAELEICSPDVGLAPYNLLA